MQLSITTDYVTDRGDPSPYLARVAAAGFTHIHWCHHWRSDFLYADAEIAQIERWLKQYDLILNDVHGSEGVEKFWYSPHEYAREAGIELVKNRIDFAARLGADVVVMHYYPPTVHPEYARFNDVAPALIRRTLDALEPYARARGVAIALENLIDFPALHAGTVTASHAGDNFPQIQTLCAEYPPDFLGVCYDSGHANLGTDRMTKLEPLCDRLIALHLHDNDGHADDHRLLFSDAIDWTRLAELVGASSYAKPMSLELSIRHTGIDDEEEFLRQGLAGGTKFAQMVQSTRSR